MLVSQTLIIVYSLLGGPGTHTGLFTVTVILTAFFSGGNEYPRIRNAIIAYCTFSFLFLEFYFQLFPPILSFESLYLEWLRRTIDFGLIAFTLGISFDIAKEIRNSDDEIENEREKSENLLLNILPRTIATQLKLDHGVIAERYEESSVLFADIAGFTVMSSTMAPDQVVQMLDEVFREFDDLARRLGLEKIKTIGDAYMVAAGLPERRSDHCEAIFKLAVEMQDLMREKFSIKYNGLALRIGIHTGPVVAGVIGTVKFAYDLWGDTVNTASRMESHGVTGHIQVTEAVYEKLKNRYTFELRGELDIKGKGKMKTYLFPV
ncbi:adenylate/guanylate cyclase [Leptospira johnsonii]|uniref:Adenylate cyclase n=2 Tax=Leptospira johnsonii TaxID=1917820 RepID=A0A2P2D3W1_9LEPT|nr:adenylate/guanylate cyclase [Leptospira johnsonii]